jgi:hypothetical protein
MGRFSLRSSAFGDATLRRSANADTDNLHKSGNASSTMIRAGLADTLD